MREAGSAGSLSHPERRRRSRRAARLVHRRPLLPPASPSAPAKLAAALPAGYKLLANKYYVDEIYGAVVVKPLLAFSKLHPRLGRRRRNPRRRSVAARRHRQLSAERFCSAGSRAICAPMRHGWLPERPRYCSSSSCWFHGHGAGRLHRNSTWHGGALRDERNRTNRFSPSSCWFRWPAQSSSRSCPIAASCPTGLRCSPRWSPSASRCICPLTSSPAKADSSLRSHRRGSRTPRSTTTSASTA